MGPSHDRSLGIALGDVGDFGRLVVPVELADVDTIGLARAYGGFCGSHPAQLAMDVVTDVLRGRAAPQENLDGDRGLASALRVAHDVVAESAVGIHAGHMCSAALMRVRGKSVVVAHSGDCRVYRYRHAENRSATMLCGPAVLAREHSVTRFHETSTSRRYDGVLVHGLGLAAPLIETLHTTHQPGDVYALATDGVHRAVDGVTLARVFEEHHGDSPAELAEAIFDACRWDTGRNNHAGVVVYRPSSAEQSEGGDPLDPAGRGRAR